MAFLPFWLLFWTIGGIAAAIALVLGEAGGASAFLVLWLFFWAVAWVMVASTITWTLFGREVVVADDTALTTWSEVGGRSFRRRDFAAREIKDLRAAGYFGSIHSSYGRSWSSQLHWLGLAGGVIAFEFRGKTERFGIQLEEWEARNLVKLLAQVMPEEVLPAP